MANVLASVEPVATRHMVATVGVVAVLGIVGLAILIFAGRRLRDTTLWAPTCWAGLALTAVAAVELAAVLSLSGTEEPWGISPLRYTAAVLTFCPAMAVLGAKQPQNRAWQWVVLSLTAVLLLPVLEGIAFRPGQPLVLHTAWQWFLWILWGTALANYLPTRFAPAAALVAAGQVILAWDWLITIADRRAQPLLGLGLIVASLVAATAISRRQRTPRGFDRVWGDFHDWYGVVWSLRIMERFNHDAAKENCGRLTWNGLEPTDSTAAAQRILDWLLRRFVSRDWIDRRLESSGQNEQAMQPVEHGADR